MGEFYEYCPPGPEQQHARLVALRQLTSRGIPCIMWAEDALCYVYRVATALFDQQILVPDQLLEAAAAILQEGRYVPTVPAWDYAEMRPPNEGSSPFPKSIRLRHLDIPDHEPYKLEPLPGYILLLPMSYFAMDVRDKARFQSLVPPLDSSNSDILVPKYHTFLEGLVHFIMNPATGLLDSPHPHVMGKSKHDVFMGYLLSRRVFYDYDVPLPRDELLPEEQKILGELQTEEARWYLHHVFSKRRNVNFKDIIEYKLKQRSVEGHAQAGSDITPLPTHDHQTLTSGQATSSSSVLVHHRTGCTSRSYSTTASASAPNGSFIPRLPCLRDRMYEGGAMPAVKAAMRTSRMLRRAL